MVLLLLSTSLREFLVGVDETGCKVGYQLAGAYQ
jgi:hypothetical protein